MASSLSLLTSLPKPSFPPSISSNHHRRRISFVRSSLSTQPLVAGPDDLVSTILSKVKGTDRGVLLSKDGHREVSDVAQKLQKYCVSEPVKCPLIFGEWDVLYCSVPTSPGGGYRSSFGRLFLNAKEMVQVVEAPDIVLNKVSFSVLGFLDGEVSLKGCWPGSSPSVLPLRFLCLPGSFPLALAVRWMCPAGLSGAAPFGCLLAFCHPFADWIVWAAAWVVWLPLLSYI
ncbi:probable plastid-lipid-associated protein 8, chloroplastic isoform X1 [Dendrobium catenatum]|uniref:probable plastid-lipid-associated protein 8, chloroplastic isoform X1 n=1 Tax=Dendrobium catenatum TaxID=906689 RepID=UPI0009F5FF7C|nr:probable plastid-lipid-associated protein 8, chloroplastic isoform X1 [Dendrobium catenatum]